MSAGGIMGCVVNERLRRAMLRAGYSVETLADAAGVVSKSVQRWITGEVTPFARTRFRVAALLQEDEGYLWPQAVNHAALTGAELAASYPRRADVPGHLWTDLLRAAQRNIDVLAFAGLFLTEEHSGWLTALAGKVGTNARIRLLLGDPDGSQLAARDREYSIGGGVAGRVLAVLSYYRQLPDGVELRLHDTPLYNSIYRFDDEMLVNTHLFGTPAAYAPILHLRRLAGGELFDNYTASFSQVLARSRAVWPED
jgi:transcriptional regulator with XRE-family HTH domain